MAPGFDLGDADCNRAGTKSHRELLLQFFQCQLRLVERGNVTRHAEHADQAAVIIDHRRLDRVEQRAMTIVGEDHPFIVGARAAGGHCGAVLGAKGIGQFPFDKRVVGLADDVGLGRAKQIREAPVAAQIHPIGVLEPHRIGNRIEHGTQVQALAQQCLLGFLGIGDVHHHPRRAQRPAIRAARDHPAAETHPAPAAVALPHATLLLHRHVLMHRHHRGIAHRPAVVRMERGAQALAVLRQVLCGHAE